MGCDIHIHAEVKMNDRWEHVGEYHFNRNYEAFSAMAFCGRSDMPPLFKNKDIPKDCNPLTKWYMTCVDFHSHSWLNEKEIKKLCEWFTENDCEKYKDILEEIFAYGLDEFAYRIVFAFDN